MLQALFCPNSMLQFFVAVVNGKKAIKTSNEAKLFLDAICDQEDRASGAERLEAAADGLTV
jgi:hypothetical protein